MPSWFAYELTDPTTGQVRAYEHQVSVHLPWRRYYRDNRPSVVSGSPSVITVGEETRHGTELAICRVSYDPSPCAEVKAELLGELVEAWVFLTVEVSTSVDPRWDV